MTVYEKLERLDLENLPGKNRAAAIFLAEAAATATHVVNATMYASWACERAGISREEMLKEAFGSPAWPDTYKLIRRIVSAGLPGYTGQVR